MTVPATARRAGPFLGAGSTLVCPFTFKVFSASDVVVTRADSSGTETVLALGTDYTVSLNADQDTSPGGSVTTVAVVPTGSRVVITGGVAASQPTDLPGGGRFPAGAVENALDRNAILVQQVLEQIARALRLPVTSGADPQLPPPTPGALIGWNDAATALVNRLSAGTLSVSAFAQTLLALTTAAAFRSAIGAPDATLVAPLNSPALTGNPTAPTPAANDNDTSIATTGYVQTELTDLLAAISGNLWALASQAQAEAGTDNATTMSPLRTRQAIDARAVVRGFPDLSRRYEEFTDLIGAHTGASVNGILVTPALEMFGSGGPQSAGLQESGRPGVLRVNESGAGGLLTGVRMRSAIRMDQAGDFEVVLRTNSIASGVPNVGYRIGWVTDAQTVGIAFYGQASVNANWLVQSGNGTITTQITSGVAVSNTGFFRLRCRRVDADTFAFSINGGAETNVTRAGAGANWPADAAAVRLQIAGVNSYSGLGPDIDSIYYSTLGATR